jgi:predicted MPP superfamily phosphohydrolase
LHKHSGLLLGIAFLAFNLVGGMALVLRVFHFFRAIFAIYVTSVVLFPIVLLLAVLARRVVSDSWRLERQDVMMVSGAAALLLVFAYASLIEPTRLQVETIHIVSEKATAPFTILHISDIQSAAIGGYERRAFRRMAELQPDLIVHTGDLLQPYLFKDIESERQKLAQLFRTLDPPYGIYNVVGDVDWRLSFDDFDRQAGIQTLQNASRTISVQGTTIHLLGLSLASSRRGNRELVRQWHSRQGENDFSVLFGHAPDYVLDIPELNIDLALADHTHGGQIRLPFIGPLVTLSRIPREWAMGFRTFDNIRLNVSAGIGAEHASQLPPIRVNCPPAMTLFTIQPES